MGIGASFDTPERDVQIANAGLTALPDARNVKNNCGRPRYFRQE
jgi:hypothetical protein